MGATKISASVRDGRFYVGPLTNPAADRTCHCFGDHRSPLQPNCGLPLHRMISGGDFISSV
jgi:hypothetical protein